jgi:S1-C subfamily serine protease
MCAASVVRTIHAEESPMEADALATLSSRIAALVAERSAHVVRVDGRRRGPASGVVWSADGLVVTSSHAVERDEELEVGLPSGDSAEAELVGRDPTTDLAVVRVRATGLSAVEWAGATPAAGEIVLALSRPGRSPRAAIALLARAAGESGAPRADASTGGSRRRSIRPRASPARSRSARRARPSGSPPPGSCAVR